MATQEISNIIYDIKEQISDQQFKTIMDNLMELNKLKKDEDSEDELKKEFFRQFFYHSHKNNNCFFYQYNNQNNSIWTSFVYQANLFNINDQFLYSKTFDVLTHEIKVSYARITKIMPRYCYIEVDGFNKKISNLTLTKVVYFPYINLC